ncbi:hypothetical protein MUY27_10020 [Mucilaginibacter sp. RS28]|uniref:Outer membrane protein beta-barrel domain-containing protein n=1 Tax=Mucilaginibacter straminoryzae TaxID=2932774 RepID=A0A9X2B9S1_9SPHI|nr:hypothetical protein [Mucilaginibacter straminoryzae]MCJ8210045.1 hypothetical protein [Mucilaginibacter straminoryzae]
MKKLFYTICMGAALFSADRAAAQSSGKGWMGSAAGTAQIQVTYRNTNLDQLNGVLNRNGIPSLGGNDVWLNLSMNHIHNKFIMEDGLGFTPTSTAENNGLKAKLNQYQAYLRAGYDIGNSPVARFFPFVGVNFSAAMLRLQDDRRMNAVNDFSQELLNSTSSKNLYQGNFGVELGMGFDYLIKMKPKSVDCFTIQRSIPIGVRGGYYINAARSDWHVDGHSLDNGPDKNQSAVFLSVNIGLGYAISK